MSNLNSQQFGKHAPTDLKVSSMSSVQGHTYGSVDVSSTRTQGPVKAGYVGKHAKNKFRSDTEPDQGYSKSEIKKLHG
jgi:hypothetical protein